MRMGNSVSRSSLFSKKMDPLVIPITAANPLMRDSGTNQRLFGVIQHLRSQAQIFDCYSLAGFWWSVRSNADCIRDIRVVIKILFPRKRNSSSVLPLFRMYYSL